jgi:hypothetical protein
MDAKRLWKAAKRSAASLGAKRDGYTTANDSPGAKRDEKLVARRCALHRRHDNLRLHAHRHRVHHGRTSASSWKP